MNTTKDEFEDWKESYITKEFFKFLRHEAALHRQIAASGQCVGKDMTSTGEEYVKIIHRASIYEMIPDVQYEDVFPEEDLNESDSSWVQGFSKT